MPWLLNPGVPCHEGDLVSSRQPYPRIKWKRHVESAPLSRRTVVGIPKRSIVFGPRWSWPVGAGFHGGSHEFWASV